MGKHSPKKRANDRRKKGFGTSGSGTCDKCGVQAAHVVKGKRHRRCGGTQGAEPRPKHSIASVRGVWR